MGSFGKIKIFFSGKLPEGAQEKSTVQLLCRKLPAFRIWNPFYDPTIFSLRNLLLKLEMLRFYYIFRYKNHLFWLSQFSGDIWFQKLPEVPPNGLYWQYGWLASFEGKFLSRESHLPLLRFNYLWESNILGDFLK